LNKNVYIITGQLKLKQNLRHIGGMTYYRPPFDIFGGRVGGTCPPVPAGLTPLDKMFEFSLWYSDCLASKFQLPIATACTALVACCQSWTACRL